MLRHTLCIALIGVALVWPRPSHAHGRLWDPPSRSSMFRWGFDVPANYNDNELFCGGFHHQVSLGYRCGVCGDAWDGVRHNEAGGRYATGQISRYYHEGDTVTVKVQLTANHKGWFEFRLCPVNDPTVRATKECLDSNILPRADGSGTRFPITTEMGSREFSIQVALPADLTCTQCVMQWRYHAGNSWGTNTDDGQSCVGCGPQEEFYGCADVAILSAGEELPETLVSSQAGSASVAGSGQGSGSVVTGTSGNRGTGAGTGSGATNGRSGVGIVTGTGSAGESGGAGRGSGSGSRPGGIVVGVAGGAGIPPTPTWVPTTSGQNGMNGDNLVCTSLSGAVGMDTWCQLNCQGGNCPPDHCRCEERPYAHTSPRPAGCRGAGVYASVPGYDDWCRDNCAAGNCPSNICVC